MTSIKPERVVSQPSGVIAERPPLVSPRDLEYVLASGLMLSLRFVPLSKRLQIIESLSHFVGRVWHLTNLNNVRRIRYNLQHLFGSTLSSTEIEQHIRGVLTLTAWNSMIVDLLPSLDDEQAKTLLPLDGLHHIAERQAQGKPILLLGAHVGVFAYAIAAVLYAHGYDLCEVGFGGQPKVGSSLLYQKLYWPRVAAVRQRFQVFDPHNGPQRILLDTFKRGHIVYLLPDEYTILQPEQEPPPNLAAINFLGGIVYLETGGLRLAKRMDAEIITALPRQENGRQRIYFEPLGYATDGFTLPDLTQDLSCFMALVETRIQEQPFLWRDLRRDDLFQRLHRKINRS